MFYVLTLGFQGVGVARTHSWGLGLIGLGV